MRRPLAATLTAAAAAVLLAGCSADTSDSGEAATPAPAPSAAAGSTSGAPAAGAAGAPASKGPAGAAGDAALSGDTAAICAQAAKTSVAFATTFADNVELQIEAASVGEPGAMQRAEQKAARDLQNYSYALKDMSKLAADPAVKKALGDMGERVTALKGNVSKIDERELAGLRATLDEACGTK